MDVVSRYIFRQTASALVMILISLTLIVWLTTALRELELVTSHGQSFFIFLQITLLALPNLIAIIAPVALLIACLYTLNRLGNDSELIVLTAAGATIWRVFRPYALLACIVSAFVLLANAYLTPNSLRLLKSYIVQVRTDLISQVIQPGNFASPEKGLTFHIRDRDPNGDLLGLLVHDERDKSQIMTYLAERGQVIKQGERAFLVMQGGQIQRADKERNNIQIIAFDSYIFDITDLGPQTGEPSYKPKERFLIELLNPDPNDPQYQKRPGKFRSELHERLANPLYPIVFALIALAYLGYARTNRQARLHSIAAAFGLAVLVRGAGLAATNLAVKEPWAVWLIYAIPVGAILAGVIIAHRNMRPKTEWNLQIPVPGWVKSRFLRKLGAQTNVQGAQGV